ncbi:MAG: metallophosphoesterase family protein [Candidatus Micrarchaeia archaeon]|jgi:calcineurin-like phosphoesterase family protein
MLEKNIYLISDLHLDHTNIIKYCKRPFKTVEQMNKKILDNWNNKIKEEDTVYFIGDLTFGRESSGFDFWAEKLKGKIIFIKGGHDKSKKINFLKQTTLDYKNMDFLLIHNPKDSPKNWKNWIIHGHHHNHYLDTFPFINGKTKTINVSSELIGYSPLNINKLFELDFKNIIYMKNIFSKPIYK